MQSNKATEPIRVFKNDKELQECGKWWEKRLFLENWFIKYELVNKQLAKECGEPIDGYCQFSMENKEAKIVISNLSVDGVIQFSAELTLIHELLHLKREYLPNNYFSDEQTVNDVLIHQSQEEMAKALLLTKYNLEKSWFMK